MLYVEIGLPHTEFIPRKKLVDPPRLLPDYSKMGARYSGMEPMKQFEIDALCKRLSKPKVQSSDNERPKSVRERMSVRTNVKPSSATRFVGSKKMTSSDIKSLVDRLSNTKSSRVPESQRVPTTEDKLVKGVVASHAWNGHEKNYHKSSYEHFEKYVHKVRSSF